MTSRALFYKGMKEDLKHRVWMIALSVLGSFMAFPISYLLFQQSWKRRETFIIEYNYFTTLTDYRLDVLTEYFKTAMTITGGIICVLGALIVAIFGFRYVFSKKMIDLYHSIPLNRRTLFLIHYIDGFLIWFVPMLIAALLTGGMGLAYLHNAGAALQLIKELLLTVGNLTLVFLMVYHLALVAVMLSGNILNVLVSGGILGFSIVAFFCLLEGFAGLYLNTYYSTFGEHIDEFLWTSPLIAAVYQLVLRTQPFSLLPVALNIFVMAALFIAGYLLYLKRPSEIAEQGIKIKAVAGAFRLLTSVIAGFCGWMIFTAITSIQQVGWGIFGAALSGVIAYGVMDIIFQMDFKAFFRHKLMMAVTVVATVAVGLGFYTDITGFDSYVPNRDEIASLGMCVNYHYYGSTDTGLPNREVIDGMQYTDADQIYTFLTDAVRDEKEEDYLFTCAATVKVTLKSGRSYYRVYQVYDTMEETIAPIMLSDAYAEYNLMIPEAVIESSLYNQNGYMRLENAFTYERLENKELAADIMRAYNQDVSEHIDTFVYQDREYLGHIYCFTGDYYISMDIYENLEHTLAMLADYGLKDTLTVPSEEEIDRIVLYAYPGADTGDTQLEQLRSWFGIGEEDTADTEGNESDMLDVESVEDVTYYTDYYYMAEFTERADIKKLYPHLIFQTPYNFSLFWEWDASSVDIYMDDEIYSISLENGSYLEEYLSYFEAVED